MYRSVKIKALFVFLAWGVVFLHGVIPHIHLNEQHGYCNSILHDSDPSTPENAGPDHFNGVHGEHEKVCHFSTTMFQQQGFEDLLAYTTDKPQIIPELIVLSVLPCDQNCFLSLEQTGPSLLRAPPVA